MWLLSGALLLMLILGYTTSLAIRSAKIHHRLSTPSRGWSRPAHRPDPDLGFAPIPGARSAHTFPIGPDIPMAYNKDGFRVPVGATSRNRPGPRILFLGCSYTYGDACLAEETFPHKVAQAVGGTELNAGRCSYGLAQMLLLAEDLIPKHRPDLLVVQYSPWLVNRAITPYAPAWLGTLPVPYFFLEETDEIAIPGFHSK